MIVYGSVCSGIEAATVAWHPLGWRPAWFAEIEPFPSAVLSHRYPAVPNLGDMTTLPDRIRAGEVEAPDVLCGGTPCQAFSVAGNRRSLDDARGNLTLMFLEIADAIDDVRRARGEPPCVVVWENVPGVLSVTDNAYGCFLGGLVGDAAPIVSVSRWTDAGMVAGPRRSAAWRVMDAQYFGLAQRRKRVFVVAGAGDGFDPAAVLFEFDGVRRDSAPSREAGEGVAPTALGGAQKRGGYRYDDIPLAGGDSVTRWPAEVTGAITARFGGQAMGAPEVDAGLYIPVTHSLRGEGFDASEDGTGRGTPLVADATLDLAPTLRAMPHHGSHANGGGQMAVGFYPTAGQDFPCLTECSPAVKVGSVGTSGNPPGVQQAMQVRRLTPVECERLQGFPDGYTAIPWRNKPADQCPDGPRYKALGNSWAVPVVRWIGRRIDAAVRGADPASGMTGMPGKAPTSPQDALAGIGIGADRC